MLSAEEDLARYNESRGVRVNKNNDASPADKNAELMASTEGGDDTVVESLMLKGADPQAPSSKDGYTAVHKAALYGNVRCLTVFYKFGVNLGGVDGKGRCALHMAAAKGHANVVRKLLEWGQDPNVCSEEFLCPLHESVLNEHTECTKILLQAGARPDAASSSGGTAVIFATVLGNEALLRLVLSVPSDLEVSGYRSMCALHWAALRGQVSCVNALIEFGADPDARSHHGRTAAHYAVELRGLLPFQITQALLRSNANLDAKATHICGGKKRTLSPLEVSLCFGATSVACWLALCDCNLKLVQMMCFNNNGTKKGKDSYVAWLVERAAQPLSLRSHCRIAIRRSLPTGKKFYDAVQTLPLPNKLKSFVRLEHLCSAELTEDVVVHSRLWNIT